MPGPEGYQSQTGESALSSAVYIVDTEALAPSTPEAREIFVARIPEGMDLEQERLVYEQCGGQVRHFGETVDTSTVSYQEWLVLNGAEIQYGSDLTQTT